MRQEHTPAMQDGITLAIYLLFNACNLNYLFNFFAIEALVIVGAMKVSDDGVISVEIGTTEISFRLTNLLGGDPCIVTHHIKGLQKGGLPFLQNGDSS